MRNVVVAPVVALPPVEGVQFGEILGDFPGIVGFGMHAALPKLNKKPCYLTDLQADNFTPGVH